MKRKMILQLLLLTPLFFTFGCGGSESVSNTDSGSQKKKRPDFFNFNILSPKDGEKVDVETVFFISGTCDDSKFTDDILVYPLVKAPNSAFYPYFPISPNKNGTWNSTLVVGSKASDSSGDPFYIAFCAVFKGDDTKLQEAFHSIKKPGGIDSIGISIPEYCTTIATINLKLK